jgi:hypothetical protein
LELTLKLTNKKGLPLPLVEAIKSISSQYDKGESDYTATGLLKPARMAALEKKYESKRTEDASDLIRSVRGTVIHSILEEAGKSLPKEEYLVEQRFYIDIDGIKIGAKIDLFDIETGVLYDYKTTSVYSVRYGIKEEHAQQLNIGAECLRQAGYTVNGLRIAFFPMDWREGESKKFDWYPKQYEEHEVSLIDSQEVVSFVKERVESHLLAEECLLENKKKFDKKVLCSEEETWNGRRCAKWCSVAKFCSQYKKENK